MHIADADIAEALVWHLWQEHLPKKRQLRLTDGRQVRVYHAGELNPDSGPDFLNAELAFGPGRRIRGDVEIHIRPEDWRRHGHEKDPKYNRVILHVVMWHEEGAPSAVKQNGQHMPMLVLSENLKKSFNRLRQRYERRMPEPQRNYPCETLVQTSDGTLRHLLIEAGVKRFQSKTNDFARRLERVPSEQALYEGIMTAAGYAKNTAPMSELARRLPIACIRDTVERLPAAAHTPTVQALLFGTAGLLPSQRAHAVSSDPLNTSYMLDIETRWAGLSALLSIRPMMETDWLFFRLRPQNFPTVRLAGLSCLIASNLTRNMDAPLLKAFEDGLSRHPRHRLSLLRNTFDHMLRHEPADGWDTRSPSGDARHNERIHPIGPERRRDMMVNIILPFLSAHACRAGRSEHHRAVLEMYAIHPKLSDNAVTREMTALLFGKSSRRRRVIDTARMQQGLHHIYEQTCERKDCEGCIMNRRATIR